MFYVKFSYFEGFHSNVNTGWGFQTVELENQTFKNKEVEHHNPGKTY